MPDSSPRVTFLIAGTQKGGTTALAHFLAQHPQIFMARQKELHFFDRDRFFRGKEPDYAWYHRHFEGSEGYRAVGEATPIYMYWPEAPARIHAYNPMMKFILILRNPVERAYSHYMMERRRWREFLPFRWAVRVEPLRAKLMPALFRRLYSYVSRGMYAEQIERLLGYFPREQLLVLKTEELREEHDATLQRVCSFLGVDPFPATKHELVFANTYEPIAAGDWHCLQQLYADELNRLERLLGWDCSAWRRMPSTPR